MTNKLELQEAQTLKEISDFEAKSQIKAEYFPNKIKKKATDTELSIPKPEDLNEEILNLYSPPDVSQVFSPLDHPPNPVGKFSKKLLKKGSNNWYYVDEPLIPSKEFVPRISKLSDNPFYLSARSGEPRGIKVVQDDLVEVRKKNQIRFEQYLEKRRALENKVEKSLKEQRSQISRDSLRVRQFNRLEFTKKCGQPTQVKLKRKIEPDETPIEETIDDEEKKTVDFLTAYDNYIWEQRKLKENSEDYSHNPQGVSASESLGGLINEDAILIESFHSN